MANGETGPVSQGTELQARGAQTMANALGRMLTVGQDPGVRQQVMQQYQQQGAEAAHNIRQRYFKEEFKNIQAMRFQPELDRLNTSFAEMQTKLDTQTRPVPRIVQPEEMQQRQEEMGQGTTQINTVPGAPGGPDGKPGAPQVIPQQIAAPNPTVQGDSLGAVESTELLSFTGADGRPIAVASPEGVAWRQAALTVHGDVNTSVMQNLMSIAAEYSGNPFAAKYGDSLLESVIKQSTMAATGQSDPQKGQEFLDRHAQTVAETEGQETLNERGEFAQEGAESARTASAREGMARAQSDKNFASMLTGDESIADMAAANDLFKSNQERLLKQQSQGPPTISPINATVENASNWPSETGQTHVYKTTFTAHNAEAIGVMESGVKGDLAAEGQGGTMWNELKNYGATEEEISNYMGNADYPEGILGDTVVNALKSMAAGKGITQQSNDYAHVKTLEVMAKQTPKGRGFDDVLTGVVDKGIRIRAEKLARKGRPEMTQRQIELLHADPYNSSLFFEHGRAVDDPFVSQETQRKIDAVNRKWDKLDAEQSEVSGPLALEPFRSDFLSRGSSGGWDFDEGVTVPGYRASPQGMLARGRQNAANRAIRAPATPTPKETPTTGSSASLNLLASGKSFEIEPEAEVFNPKIRTRDDQRRRSRIAGR